MAVERSTRCAAARAKMIEWSCMNNGFRRRRGAVGGLRKSIWPSRFRVKACCVNSVYFVSVGASWSDTWDPAVLVCDLLTGSFEHPLWFWRAFVWWETQFAHALEKILNCTLMSRFCCSLRDRMLLSYRVIQPYIFRLQRRVSSWWSGLICQWVLLEGCPYAMTEEYS